VRAAVQRLVDAVNERCDGELNAELGNN
jgi:hypothetical protein